MEIKQKISLDFGRDTHPITVFAKQRDKNSRFIEITPLNCGQIYSLESGIMPRLQLTKADGHTVLNDAAVQDGVIIVELTEQALAAAGVAVAEIGLYKGEALLSSQNFYIDVEKAAFDSSAPESSDEYNALTDALAEVNTVAERAAAIASEIANEAAANANNAADGAENVNISAEQTATGADISVTNREGVITTVHIDTLTAVNTWQDIKNAVRLGLGETLFSVGYEFTITDSVTGAVIAWVVRGHEHHTAANGKLTHTMTLEAKYVYGSANGTYKPLVFDATEALYYAADGLAAGTYNFTVANQAWYVADNGKTYQFTLTNAVPAGGQIVLSMTYNAALEGKSVKTYSSATSTAVIETATLTEGSEGTSLGTTDGNSNNVNHMHRAIFGSNNYAQSAARQWLNSSAAAGAVWTPTNIFDRPPSWNTSYSGFMRGLPADFLAVVEPAKIPCRTNGIFEVDSLDGTEYAINQVYELQDKFFLLSRPEIYGTWDENTRKDGTLLEYYDGLTDTERKKYDAAGSVRCCWLRSPNPWYAHNERFVHPSGALDINYAYYGYGVAPACIIA